MDGIILGSCDLPNDNRRRYTKETYWYSIQILGSEEFNDGMSEINHDVYPRDVTYRTIPSVVEFETAPPNPNNKIDVDNDDGEGAYEGETQTQTSASGSKRYREEETHVPLPPSPRTMQLLRPPPPSGIGNASTNNYGHDGYKHDPLPLAKRQCGFIKHEGNECNIPSSSHHHLPQSVDQAPSKGAKMRNFEIKYKGANEYHAIIDIPLARDEIFGKPQRRVLFIHFSHTKTMFKTSYLHLPYSNTCLEHK